jgi:hypothetical protein
MFKSKERSISSGNYALRIPENICGKYHVLAH